jgi:hypothetical protein
MNDIEELKKFIKENIIERLEKIEKELKVFRLEVIKSSTKWFDDAVQIIMDNEMIPAKEIEARYPSFSNSYVRERFREYVKNYDCYSIRIFTRGFPEMFIHAPQNSLNRKFLELWDMLLKQGGVDLDTLLKEGKITQEERAFFVAICRKYFSKFLFIDDLHVSKKRR